jgi:hypothetical protein
VKVISNVPNRDVTGRKWWDLDLFFFPGSASSPVCIDTHVSFMCLRGVKWKPKTSLTAIANFKCVEGLLVCLAEAWYGPRNSDFEDIAYT